LSYKPEEFLIAAVARALAVSKHIAVGSASPIPGAAAILARRMSPHRLRVTILGSKRQVFFTEGSRELFDSTAQGRIDAFVLGGGQIDGKANINLMGVGTYPDLKVRWPGNYGAPYLYSLAKNVVLFREEHTRRVLVPKVDYITAAGVNEPNVYRPGGPTALITDRCVFSFDRKAGRFTLQSVHPGHTAEEVKENTGFDYDAPAKVPTTPEPDAKVLQLIRGEVADQIEATYPQFVGRVFRSGAVASQA
jgi:glutaconate CoA-transferase subunit B